MGLFSAQTSFYDLIIMVKILTTFVRSGKSFTSFIFTCVFKRAQECVEVKNDAITFMDL